MITRYFSQGSDKNLHMYNHAPILQACNIGICNTDLFDAFILLLVL